MNQKFDDSQKREYCQPLATTKLVEDSDEGLEFFIESRSLKAVKSSYLLEMHSISQWALTYIMRYYFLLLMISYIIMILWTGTNFFADPLPQNEETHDYLTSKACQCSMRKSY